MEPKYQLAFGIILQCTFGWYVTEGQVLMRELDLYNIDPLTLNGTEPYTELTIDQLIMRAMGGIGVAQNLMLADDGESVLAELDMMLTQDQFFSIYEQPSTNESPAGPPPAPPVRGRRRASKRNKRKAVRDTIYRWPGGIVPYKFVTNHFREKEEYMIRVAMTEWEKYTCLRFKPATHADRNLVRFQNGQGCNSQLGMVGGEQPLNLDDNGCRFKGLYLHEIGHAIGLVHEHQLPDRDKYIEILYQNVQPNMRIWFNKYSSQEVDQMLVPYEYSSVMHYGITAFSSDGKSQTIRAKQPEKEDSIGRVYRKELSFTDVKIVNLMYKCAENCSKSIVCNDGGYIDQNCQCICPDGTDSCTKGDTGTNDPSCFNAHDNWQCLIWANQGECDRNPKFMLDGCKKACKLCGDKDKETDTHIATWAWQWLCVYTNVCPKKWTIDSCTDVYDKSKCQRWKDNGECIVNKKWMEKHCKQTCKACKNSGTDTETTCTNKHPNLAECEKWAAEGECQINSRWMPKNCQKSCHLCNKDVNKPTERPDTDDDDATCEDLHNTVECQGWADSGECRINPDWMIPNCRKSCKKCRGGDTDTGKQECLNIWDDVQCEGWARDRECMKNQAWMSKNCHKACTKCRGDTNTGGSTQTTRRPPTTTTEKDSGICVNNHRSEKDCNTWAKHGHCQINTWMLKHCAKACKSCKAPEDKTTTTATPDTYDVTTSRKKTVGACEDDDNNCASWAEHGFCEDNPGTALVICKKSCNACSAGEQSCFDKHQLCRVWKKGGQCRRNGGYMLRNCRKSCEVC